jgi:prepilin-type N-terminal cleavage/methylation domain-containing protein
MPFVLRPLERRPRARFSGFSLIELAMVLFIISLLMGYFLSTGNVFMEIGKRKDTETRLKAIEAALAGYVAINGRLPCPADGSLTSANASNGKENGDSTGCTDNQQNGVVPWIPLGLSEADVVDSWFRRITYRVGNGLWANDGMSMVQCDPIGTGAASGVGPAALCMPGCTGTPACTPPAGFMAAGKGLLIKDAATSIVALMDPSVAPSTGAAYILISHGKNFLGSFPIGGGTMMAITGSGDNEVPNQNGVAVTFGTTFFVDREFNEAAGSTYFDDLIVRPSIISVLLKAQRGPRTH